MTLSAHLLAGVRFKMEIIKPWELFPNYQEELEFEGLSADGFELKIHLANVNWNVYIKFDRILTFKLLPQDCYFNKIWWGSLKQGSCYLVENSEYILSFDRETQGLMQYMGDVVLWKQYCIVTVDGCLDIITSDSVNVKWEKNLEFC